ncbi:hypothetical protein [Methylobacterium sp. V23]|uniref:hypothetical protein n=1 Tax=Methylobacterium sp. V23 TaxID=2044878 RepID=UPI0011B0F1AB|nr:hypothetical protein [Methylobacterium sp. V23]
MSEDNQNYAGMFSPDMISSLRYLLGHDISLQGMIETRDFLNMIADAVFKTKIDIEERSVRVVSTQRDAKRLLTKIINSAEALSEGLGESGNLTELLLTGPDRPLSLISRGEIQDHEMFLQNTLSNIIEQARFMSKQGEFLRRAVGLSPGEHPNKSPIQACLWRRLFYLWERSGKKVSYSIEPRSGKRRKPVLIDFIKLVHEAAGFDPPNHEEVKDAAAEWRRLRVDDPRLSRLKPKRGQNLP